MTIHVVHMMSDNLKSKRGYDMLYKKLSIYTTLLLLISLLLPNGYGNIYKPNPVFARSLESDDNYISNYDPNLLQNDDELITTYQIHNGDQTHTFPYASGVLIEGEKTVGSRITGKYTFNGTQESGTTYKWYYTKGIETEIYSNNNAAGVGQNPPNPTMFTISSSPLLISQIQNYHYGSVNSLGTIGLMDQNGKIYGPWQAEVGYNKWYWKVNPYIVLQPGTYTIVDSSKETWSCNPSSGNSGISDVYAISNYNDANWSIIEGATSVDYVLTSNDLGSFLKFEVTVKDAEGEVGAPVQSEAFGPVIKSSSSLSNDVSLRSLLLNGVDFAPRYNSGESGCKVTISNEGESITVDVLPSDSNAVVKINDEIVNKKVIDLVVGENTISIVVIAEDGVTTKTYTMTVDRLALEPQEETNYIYYYPIVSTTQQDNGNYLMSTQVYSHYFSDYVSSFIPTGTVDALINEVKFLNTNDEEDIIELAIDSSLDKDLLISIYNNDLKRLINETKSTVSLKSTISNILFDNEALQKINSMETGGIVSINQNLREVNEYDSDLKVKKLLEFEIAIRNGSSQITDLGDANVLIKIPYDLQNEDPSTIIAYQLLEKGEAKILKGFYDTNKKTMAFSVKTLSPIIIGSRNIKFNDVLPENPSSKYINFLAARNISNGIGNNIYGTNIDITRAQFLVMLMRAFNIDTINDNDLQHDYFLDIPRDNFSAYILKARNLGIVNGVGENRFEPQRKITNEELLVMVYNTLKFKEELTPIKSQNEILSFEDEEEISIWAKGAINELINRGVITWLNGKIEPERTVSREESARIIYELLTN